MTSTNKLRNQGRLGVVSLIESPTGNVGVELGVAEGDFSSELLESGRFERLYGVDAFAFGRHNVNEYKTALRRLGMDGRYVLLRMSFDDALDLFDDDSLDFVYIDGFAHTGQEGGETIWKWASKVKPGGVISGHDYDPAFPLTIKSVNGFIEATGLDLHVTDSDGGFPSWAAIKTGGLPAEGQGDRRLRAMARRAHLYWRLRRIAGETFHWLLGLVGRVRQ